jgi:probable HAF family extracellular repeat protein
VSADGSVVVGDSRVPSTGRPHAFRWTVAGGMQDLTPGGGALDSSFAYAVSADGATVCGDGVNAAFRWTVAGGLQELGTLGNPPGPSVARAMSADGSVVIGTDSSLSFRTFRWTASDGMTALGLESSSVPVLRVSRDGGVVVGEAFDGASDRPYRVEFSPIGVTGCRPAAANATGCGGFLRATGSASVAANALMLEATSLPPGAFGYAVVSADSGPPTPASVGRGTICLGASIGRLLGPGQIGRADASGSFSVAVDLNALPGPTGPIGGAPGDTWTFQVWHRDVDALATTNWTDSVTVTLQ